MCVVSLVTQGIQQQYPPLQTWSLQQTVDVSEVLKKLDAIDKKLGSKECPADAPKREFLEQLEKRIAALEAAQK